MTSQAAEELGLDENELRDALRAGSSLSDLAKEKGVSRDQLVDAIGDGLEEAARQTGRSLGGAHPDRLAERIADRVMRGGGVPRSRGPAAGYMPVAEPPTLDLLA